MRAVVIREPGPPDVLVVQERPDPVPPPSHVVVRVAYSGVNRADLLQRMGFYPPPPGVAPDIPGLEYMGTVESVGPGATLHSVGARVFGITGGAAYAERVCVHEREAVAIPAGIPDRDAAAIPEAFITAYDALVVRGRLQPGEKVLVHAAGSGVGTAVIQVAHALGCPVVGTSRTAGKLERCRALGMDHGIVVEGGAFADRVNELSGGGVDVVVDLVGGPYTAESLRACAPRGRVVLVGLTGGGDAEVDLRVVLTRRLELVGTVLRSRPLEEKLEAARLLHRTLVPWLVQRKIAGVVEEVVPAAEARRAHSLLADNRTFGKVLLQW